VLKGAKIEGFRTLLVCEKRRLSLYNRFNFIDEMIVVENFNEILGHSCQQRLSQTNSIIIPIGTLIAYMNSEQIESLTTPIFGNKWILRWEADRELKQKLMEESQLITPRHIKSKNDIGKLCIVKLHGAAGGRGYFLAWNKKTFEEGARKLVEQNAIKNEDDLYIQEYVMGVPTYLQFFYSPLTNELELMGVDKRYESDVDGIGRIPAKQQKRHIIAGLLSSVIAATAIRAGSRPASATTTAAVTTPVVPTRPASATAVCRQVWLAPNALKTPIAPVTLSAMSTPRRAWKPTARRASTTATVSLAAATCTPACALACAYPRSSTTAPCIRCRRITRA